MIGGAGSPNVLRVTVSRDRVVGESPFLFAYWYSLSIHNEHESESHSVVFISLPPNGRYSPWNLPGQNTGVGSCSLRQGIFLTLGSNPGLPHCRQILYQLSHQGSPVMNMHYSKNYCRIFFKGWNIATGAHILNKWKTLNLAVKLDVRIRLLFLFVSDRILLVASGRNPIQISLNQKGVLPGRTLGQYQYGRKTSGSRTAGGRIGFSWILLLRLLLAFIILMSSNGLEDADPQSSKARRERQGSLYAHSALLRGAFWLVQVRLRVHSLDQALWPWGWWGSHSPTPIELSWIQEWEIEAALQKRKELLWVSMNN